MAWQSMSGLGSNQGNGANVPGDLQQVINQQQGTEYTLQGVMRFLQTEWHRHERDRNSWEIERQEMKGRIAKLEGSTRKSDAGNRALKKYVGILEVALKDRDKLVKDLKAGREHTESIRIVKERDSRATKEKSRSGPHSSFLNIMEDDGENMDQDPDRKNLKSFIEKTQGELTYLMLSASNPLPPRESIDELMPLRFGPGSMQQNPEEVFRYHTRPRNMHSNQQHPSQIPSQQPPQASALRTNRNSGSSSSPIEKKPSAQSTTQEWPSNFQSVENPPEPRVTKPNHAFHQYESQPTCEEEKYLQNEANGWDFNEEATFAESESKPQRPDTDLFPMAQDPLKLTGRSGSNRGKSSLTQKKILEQESPQNIDGNNFKLRFGLRGHLDVVRSVIFTGGGSPGEPEICTAGDDGTIKRWIIPARYEGQSLPNVELDIQSNFTHRGHSGAVLCLSSWSPLQNCFNGSRAQGDGWIFSGGQDATIRVWERGRVDPKAMIDGHTDAIWAICVLPGTAGNVLGSSKPSYGGADRILLASGSADGTIKIWSVSTPPQSNSPSGGNRRGGRVRGNSMSSGSNFSSSPQPSMASNYPFHYTIVHSISRANSSASPTCIAPLSPSGDTFVAAYSDAAVLVYDTRTGEQVSVMDSLETYDKTIATGVNAVVASTLSLDGSPNFDATRGLSEDEDILRNSSTNSSVEGIIISGHEDRFIRFYDANSGQCTYNMLAHPAAIAALSLSPDERKLVSAGHDASLRFWSLEKRSCIQEITSHRIMRGEGVCSVSWSKDGRWVLSAGGDGVVKVFSQ
ncbi:Striatin [Podosphaera aphanis]|nr:Striatin [Podosphaera aphanis]